VLDDRDAAVTADHEPSTDEQHQRHGEQADTGGGEGVPDDPARDTDAGEQAGADRQADAEQEPADLAVALGDLLLAQSPAEVPPGRAPRRRPSRHRDLCTSHGPAPGPETRALSCSYGLAFDTTLRSGGDSVGPRPWRTMLCRVSSRVALDGGQRMTRI
jgi:hypothetical protein